MSLFQNCYQTSNDDITRTRWVGPWFGLIV